MNLETLDIVWPALLAGLLVLTTHIPLGQRVLDRGIVFLDLAIAQIAALGMLLAHLLGLPADALLAQALVFATALLGAALLSWTERVASVQQEAVIGSAFVVSASLAVLLVSDDPHGGEYLKEILAGQILWVSGAALFYTGLLYAGILGLWWWRRGRLSEGLFYALFALAITSSVQLVGVYLVFTSLILPALATRGLSRRRSAWAGAIGVTGYVGGLLWSLLLDRPAGGVIVVWMALLTLLFAVVRTRRRE